MILGALLIILGAAWLLASLYGWQAPAERLWLLWPLVLVWLGLEIALGSSQRARRLTAAVLLLLLVSSAYWLLVPGAPAGFRHRVVSLPLNGVNEVDLVLEVPLARLSISGGTREAGDLLEGELDLPAYNRPHIPKRYRGQKAFIELRSDVSNLRFQKKTPAWSLRLNDKPFYRLTLELGVGNANLDLHSLRLRALKLNAGVGRVYVALPRGSYPAQIHGGIGELTVSVPASQPVYLSVQRGLGGVKLEGVQTNSSPAKSIRLEISSGVGPVRIVGRRN